MKETMLQVDGMSCPSRVRHIDSALRELGGVAKIDVRLREGTVVVQHDPASAPVPAPRRGRARGRLRRAPRAPPERAQRPGAWRDADSASRHEISMPRSTLQ